MARIRTTPGLFGLNVTLGSRWRDRGELPPRFGCQTRSWERDNTHSLIAALPGPNRDSAKAAEGEGDDCSGGVHEPLHKRTLLVVTTHVLNRQGPAARNRQKASLPSGRSGGDQVCASLSPLSRSLLDRTCRCRSAEHLQSRFQRRAGADDNPPQGLSLPGACCPGDTNGR